MSRTPDRMFKKILSGKYKMDKGLSEEAQSLIRKLLRINPMERPFDVKEVMKHKIFADID